jgi:hypothetical protein
MELVLDERFIRIENNADDSLMVHSWKSETSKMEDAEYREIAVKQTEILEKYTPKRWFVNTTEFNFPIVPKTQEWADETLFPRILAAGVKFIAFVLHPDLVTQLSIEQLMEEKNVETANFEIQYFENKANAIKWLLNT